jgi:hypothetical protein
MSQDVFNDAQMSSIRIAADRVAEALSAKKEKQKLIVARAVFDIAAETSEFDAAKLVEMAQTRLTARLGWRF